jgi:hypothetical protein
MRRDDSVLLSDRNTWRYSNCENEDLFILPLMKELCWQMELQHHDFTQWEIVWNGKDLYLHISLDKVDTAVPTRANLLLPFVLSVLLGRKSVYENGWQWNMWSCVEGKCLRFETATAGGSNMNSIYAGILWMPSRVQTRRWDSCLVASLLLL